MAKAEPDPIPRIVCRMQKLKSFVQIGVVAAHNARTHPCKSADPNRIHLNQVLVGTGDVLADAKTAIARVDGPVRKNGVLAIEIILTARASWFTEVLTRCDEFRDRSIDMSKLRYGDRLVSAYWHLDEDAPHLHLVIVPLELKPNGKLKLNCRAAFGTAEALRTLQDWAGELGAPLGLERGKKRLVEEIRVPYKPPSQYRAETHAMHDAVIKAQAEVESLRKDAEADRTAAANARAKAESLGIEAADDWATAARSRIDAETLRAELGTLRKEITANHAATRLELGKASDDARRAGAMIDAVAYTLEKFCEGHIVGADPISAKLMLKPNLSTLYSSEIEAKVGPAMAQCCRLVNSLSNIVQTLPKEAQEWYLVEVEKRVGQLREIRESVEVNFSPAATAGASIDTGRASRHELIDEFLTDNSDDAGLSLPIISDDGQDMAPDGGPNDTVEECEECSTGNSAIVAP